MGRPRQGVMWYRLNDFCHPLCRVILMPVFSLWLIFKVLTRVDTFFERAWELWTTDSDDGGSGSSGCAGSCHMKATSKRAR